MFNLLILQLKLLWVKSGRIDAFTVGAAAVTLFLIFLQSDKCY